MNISINNFKSIKELKELEVSNLNLLAGVNSAGKSSVSQFLLILKQTLRTESLSEVLLNDGPYIKTAPWSELIHEKGGSLSFSLRLQRSEVFNAREYDTLMRDKETMKELTINCGFCLENGVLVPNWFRITIMGTDGWHDLHCTKMQSNRSKYKLISTSELMKTKINKGYYVTFSSMFPLFFENETRVDGEMVQRTELIPVGKMAKETMKYCFERIQYIGPERSCAEGKMQSFTSLNFDNVGVKGEYTRFLLHQKRDFKVNSEGTLISLVNKWMCKEWGLARSLDCIKLPQNTYQVVLVDNRGVKVDLWQVGYGIGQVLPIIVQGLLCPKDGIFIVDSPEIHMHPRVQSGLMDFFLSLVKEGKRVIVETHSDHLITRLRRRVAEKSVSTDEVMISFVSQQEVGSVYVPVVLTDQGASSSKMPEGFLDTMDEDYRAILKARMK